MTALRAAYLMPHPPVMIDEIGGREAEKVSSTQESARKVAKQIKQISPETVVVITPHGPVFQDAICISALPELEGDFAGFGAYELEFHFRNNVDLVRLIMKHAGKKDVQTVALDESLAREYGLSNKLDHGVLVPLYFILKEYQEFKLLHISIGLLTFEELYAFGIALREAIDETGRNTVVIASGDLSHRLTPDAPAGYNPDGKVFDKKLVKALEKLDVMEIMEFNHSLIENAGECGLRPVMMMLGAIDGLNVKSEIMSYEGPFGVGYCVAGFSVKGENPDRKLFKNISNKRKQEIEERRQKEDPYVRLARMSLESYIAKGKRIEPPEDIPEELIKNRAGVFVSIKKHGQLRGCIGTITPTQDSIAQEIIQNAISAGCEDPRFFPVTEKELSELVYSVDVLMQPEPIDSIEQLDPKRYGVIVRKGFRTGLLLPNLEGIDTAEKQVEIACQKAGLRPGEKGIKLERFEVVRHF